MNAIRAMAHTGWTTAWKVTESIASCTAKAVQQVANPILSRASQLVPISPKSKEIFTSLGYTTAGLATLSVAIATGSIPLVCVGGGITNVGRKNTLALLDEAIQNGRSSLLAIERLKERLNEPNVVLEQIKLEIKEALFPISTTPRLPEILEAIRQAQDKASLIQQIEIAANLTSLLEGVLTSAKRIINPSVLMLALLVTHIAYRNYGQKHFVCN